MISRSPEQTQAVGRTLGSRAQPGDVVLLVGGLGTGKTCITQGIAWGLDVEEHARSPTFVLVSHYQGRLTLNHVDLYRVGAAGEAADLGLEELMLGDGVTVVEWADKSPDLFAEDHLLVEFEFLDEHTRRLSLAATTRRFAESITEVQSAAARG